MDLNLISFVGVDTKTNFDDLLKLPNNIPCEFSVLFSESKNTDRYPNYEFCKEFLEFGKCQSNIKTSLHLCGSEAISKYLAQDQKIIKLCELSYRIQLNFNINNYLNYLELSNNLLNIVQLYNHKLILQQNKSKKEFLECFKKINKEEDIPKINLLYDSSGGFGREIATVICPDNKYYTGYAGGINPDNVIKIVNLIEESNLNKNKYYIDMESGIRENNILSLDKVKKVINNLSY